MREHEDEAAVGRKAARRGRGAALAFAALIAVAPATTAQIDAEAAPRGGEAQAADVAPLRAPAPSGAQPARRLAAVETAAPQAPAAPIEQAQATPAPAPAQTAPQPAQATPEPAEAETAPPPPLSERTPGPAIRNGRVAAGRILAVKAWLDDAPEDAPKPPATTDPTAPPPALLVVETNLETPCPGDFVRLVGRGSYGMDGRTFLLLGRVSRPEECSAEPASRTLRYKVVIPRRDAFDKVAIRIHDSIRRAPISAAP